MSVFVHGHTYRAADHAANFLRILVFYKSDDWVYYSITADISPIPSQSGSYEFDPDPHPI
jgi:hypothetical protein